jgi:5'(3')-deoxyribonucleotidase
MAVIYLDMDGVVADFDGYAEPIVGYCTPGGKRYNDEDWKKISANERLYLILDKCPNADRLVDEVRKLSKDYNYDVRFLTAIPRQNDVPWVFWDKIQWCGLHYPHIPVWFGPYSHDKHVHCRPGDILIDDRDTNIHDWNTAGGIGILHHDTTVDNTLEILRRSVNGRAG